MNELLNKRLCDMTGEELVNLMGMSTKREHVYGIAGIQALLNCSESKAKRVKKSGVIEDAIIQDGRKIIVDVQKALTLLKEQKVGR